MTVMDDAVTVEAKDPVSTSETVAVDADSEEAGTKPGRLASGRFGKGFVGNPRGPKPGKTFASIAKEWLAKPCNPETLQTRMERLVSVLGTKCLNGDMKAIKEFLARVWPQTIRLRDETPPQQITMVMVPEQPPKDWDPEKALLQGRAPVLPGTEDVKETGDVGSSGA